MTYKSLYRAYRPQSFDEVIGQKHIVQTLKNAITRNQLAHAYLFTGPRGTGKTTLAKLLAKGLNCLNPEEAPCNHCSVCESISHEMHPDIIEIDAASNTGVDDVRDLIERVKYAPIEATKKVYIIDEVHMLTVPAFNALLKTLEEPPEHVVFILATTEIHKVLPTIISRCQRYDFTRVSQNDIELNLKRVIDAEKLEVEEGVIEIIANLADGGHRDSLTILEQLIAYSHHPIKVQEVFDLYRLSTPQEKGELLEALQNRDLLKALNNIQLLETKSIDYVRYIFDFLNLSKEFLVYDLAKDDELISALNLPVIKLLDGKIDPNLIEKLVNQLLQIAQEARFNGQYQSYLQVMVMNLIQQPQVFVETNEVKSKEELKPIKQQEKPKVEEVLEQSVPVDENIVTDKIEIIKHDETEIVPTVKPNLSQDNSDLIIQLMVLGDKSQRTKDTKVWDDKQFKLTNFKYRRIEKLINNSQIGVSNKDFIVLVTASEPIATSLQDETNFSLLGELLEEMNLKRKVFILDADQFKEITTQFLEKHKNKELPKKSDIQIDFSLPIEPEEEVEEFDTKALLEETFSNLRIED